MSVGDALDGRLRELWPRYDDEDPRGYEADKAYQRATMHRELVGGRWRPIRRGADRAVITVTCDTEDHDREGSPQLAQVWVITGRPFYLARIAGAWDQDTPSRPLAPGLLASHTAQSRSRPSRQGPRSREQFQGVPVDVIRLFLDEPDLPRLWVKCTRHGVGELSLPRLAAAYEGAASSGRRRARPLVLRLADLRV